MKKDEDGGSNEKLNQDNAVIMLDMNHLNRCSRWPNCRLSLLFVPSRYFLLTVLGVHRAPLRLMREQEEYHKCKIKHTHEKKAAICEGNLLSLPQRSKASSCLPWTLLALCEITLRESKWHQTLEVQHTHTNCKKVACEAQDEEERLQECTHRSS